MKKIYCDLCGKEIKDINYVQQSILCYYNLYDNIEADICKKCWEKKK